MQKILKPTVDSQQKSLITKNQMYYILAGLSAMGVVTSATSQVKGQEPEPTPTPEGQPVYQTVAPQVVATATISVDDSYNMQNEQGDAHNYLGTVEMVDVNGVMVPENTRLRDFLNLPNVARNATHGTIDFQALQTNTEEIPVTAMNAVWFSARSIIAQRANKPVSEVTDQEIWDFLNNEVGAIMFNYVNPIIGELSFQQALIHFGITITDPNMDNYYGPMFYTPTGFNWSALNEMMVQVSPDYLMNNLVVPVLMDPNNEGRQGFIEYLTLAFAASAVPGSIINLLAMLPEGHPFKHLAIVVTQETLSNVVMSMRNGFASLNQQQMYELLMVLRETNDFSVTFITKAPDSYPFDGADDLAYAEGQANFEDGALEMWNRFRAQVVQNNFSK